MDSPARKYFVCFAFSYLCNVLLLFCSVCGFDHADLDAEQSEWYTHLYPYKLASYQKTLLSAPTTLGVLHYNPNSPSSLGDCRADLSSGEAVASTLQIAQEGRCDAVVIWVDYELSDSHSIHAWDGHDFPVYLTVNVKYFAEPRVVQVGEVVRSRVHLDASKTEFVYEFALEN